MEMNKKIQEMASTFSKTKPSPSSLLDLTDKMTSSTFSKKIIKDPSPSSLLDLTDKMTSSTSGFVGSIVGKTSVGAKSIIPKVLGNIFPYIHKSTVYLKSTLTLIVILLVLYLGYKLVYIKHGRPFGLSNYLPIAGIKDKYPDTLDTEFYDHLSTGLANFVQLQDLQLKSSVFNNATDGDNFVKKLNKDLFFHTNSNVYKRLKNVCGNNPDKIVEENYKQFFQDILYNKNNDYKELNGTLKQILTDSTQELKQLLSTPTLFFFIDTNNYANGQPENDFYLTTYKNVDELKKLFDLSSYPKITEVLETASQRKEESNLVSGFKVVFQGEDVIPSILRKMYDGSDDPSDFESYKRNIRKLGTSGDNLVDKIEQLNGKYTKNSVDLTLTLQDKYDKRHAVESRRLELEVYDCFIVYNDFIHLVKTKKFNPEIHSGHLWHLEKLATSRVLVKSIYTPLLTEEEKSRFTSVVSNITSSISLAKYASTINLGVKACLYIYLSSQSDGTTSTKFESLAKVYLSFTELYLASTSLKAFDHLRKKRTNVDVINVYLVPAFETLFVSLIWKQNIRNVFFKNQSDFTKEHWKTIRDKMLDVTTYFDCSNKKIKSALKECSKKTLS
jgi:hypothetical protein